MKISQFPVSIRSILAVNLAVWMIAAAALIVMLLAGALSTGGASPLGAPAGDATQVEVVEVEVLDSVVVALPDDVVDTQVSSVAIVRAP